MEEKEEERQRQMSMQIDIMMRKLLFPEAKERLSNIRIANQELYLKAVQALLYLQQTGRQEKVTEEELKELLQSLSRKRETKIVRK